ncbi:unnamed protein product [Pleuronectes platessa]|uniref:Uncharacterized protein n=1 Tax=Pleuronectes platessa TaxID=8262 RepID=A0A9N7UL91_PLEPL|nr:unnamed protein product [Pleuronectes platessa]
MANATGLAEREPMSSAWVAVIDEKRISSVITERPIDSSCLRLLDRVPPTTSGFELPDRFRAYYQARLSRVSLTWFERWHLGRRDISVPVAPTPLDIVWPAATQHHLQNKPPRVPDKNRNSHLCPPQPPLDGRNENNADRDSSFNPTARNQPIVGLTETQGFHAHSITDSASVTTDGNITAIKDRIQEYQ